MFVRWAVIFSHCDDSEMVTLLFIHCDSLCVCVQFEWWWNAFNIVEWVEFYIIIFFCPCFKVRTCASLYVFMDKCVCCFEYHRCGTIYRSLIKSVAIEWQTEHQHCVFCARFQNFLLLELYSRLCDSEQIAISAVWVCATQYTLRVLSKETCCWLLGHT